MTSKVPDFPRLLRRASLIRGRGVIAVKVNRIEGAGPLANGVPYPRTGNIMTFVFVRTSQGWRITLS